MLLYLILVLVIFILSCRVNWILEWRNKIIKQPYNFNALLGLLILGFFTNLENTQKWGCIPGGESIFVISNVVLSSISISIVLMSFLLKRRALKLTFITVELLFWIFKLFYYKGGYVVSFIAAPDPIVSFYDTATLSLRLFIITNLLRKDIKIVYVLCATLTIMCLKIFVFPTQLSMHNEKMKRTKKIDQTESDVFKIMN